MTVYLLLARTIPPLIYILHSDEVTRKLEGHAKIVTSLAFSNTLNVLVSSGADAYWKLQLLADMASTLM
ncbi:unnamed protein product [Prunus armeniaca]